MTTVYRTETRDLTDRGTTPGHARRAGFVVPVLLSAFLCAGTYAAEAASGEATATVGPAGQEPAVVAASAPKDELADRIIRSLSSRKDSNDLGPLVPWLDSGLPPELTKVQIYVLNEFARVGTPAAPYEKQATELLSCPDQEVRTAAIVALGKMGNVDAVSPLLGTLQSDKAPAVRAAAARAIGELSSAIQGQSDESLAEVGQAILPSLSDPDLEVRQAVVLTLGELHWGGAGSALADLLKSDPDPAVRGLAAHSLGQLGSAQWVGPLQDALSGDASASVRLYAADALGFIGSRSSVDALVNALDDEEERVQEAAVLALRKIGDPRAIGPLERLLSRLPSQNGSPLGDRTWQTLLKVAANDRAALWDLAVKRYLAGDNRQAGEAAGLVVQAFGDGETAEVTQARLLQALAAGNGNNGEQVEPLLREAVVAVDSGKLTPEQLDALQRQLGLDVSVKQKLLEKLNDLLQANHRSLEQLGVMDQLAETVPARQAQLWQERFRILLDCVSAGDWGTVDLYLTGALQKGAGVGGAYHDLLVTLASEVRAALDQMSPVNMVGLWLHAGPRVAAHLEPRLKTGDPASLGVLVNALLDVDAQNRRRAVGFLRKVTGQNFGFDPDAPEEQRLEAVKRWQEWLTSKGEQAPVAVTNTTPVTSTGAGQ